MEKEKLLNVTDLSSYLYCPRKFYLEKIKGVPKLVSREMIEGRIRHEILEHFSNKERGFVESLPLSEQEKIISLYYNLLLSIINQILSKSRNQILSFKINPDNLQSKIFTAMNNDILLRAESVSNAMSQGFQGSQLWENLKPKYFSEFEVSSQELGLKGRVDRVMFGEEIIPFELKTREIQKVYDSDEIQVVAYAMLLEEHFNKKIKLGILESGNKKHEIIITDTLKQKVRDLIKEIREISANPKYPSNFSKCQICAHQNLCNEM